MVFQHFFFICHQFIFKRLCAPSINTLSLEYSVVYKYTTENVMYNIKITRTHAFVHTYSYIAYTQKRTQTYLPKRAETHTHTCIFYLITRIFNDSPSNQTVGVWCLFKLIVAYSKNWINPTTYTMDSKNLHLICFQEIFIEIN